jgi:DNA-binding IscR family transcriptional regulator
MKETMVSDIVEFMDGDRVYTQCGLGLKHCSSAKPCPAHERFIGIRNELKEVLETTSVYSMANGLRDGITFLKR